MHGDGGGETYAYEVPFESAGLSLGLERLSVSRVPGDDSIDDTNAAASVDDNSAISSVGITSKDCP